jgi:hypothetical protein
LRKFYTCLSILLFTSIAVPSFAQSLRYSISMPYISLGAYSTKQTDPFGFTANQAALAQVKTGGAGVFGERRFLLSENSLYGLAATIPTSKGNFGLQVNYSGFKNFNENKLGLAYGRKLGKAMDLGIQFNYYGYRVPQYGSASAINFELGAIFHISEKLNAGVHVYNPVAGKLGKGAEEEKLASAYKLGLGYDASDNFYVSAEIIKEEDKPVNVVGGVQYHFAKQFFARAGFISETGSGFAGVGLGWKNLRLDPAGNYHPQLGFSPGLLFVVNFKEGKQ